MKRKTRPEIPKPLSKGRTENPASCSDRATFDCECRKENRTCVKLPSATWCCQPLGRRIEVARKDGHDPPSKLPERKQKGHRVLRETAAGTRLQVPTLATAVSSSALGGAVLSLELKGRSHQRPPFSPFCPSP